MMELASGTLLQGGKYKIEKPLGQGGFGITYLAEQTNLGRLVCIKEFFMKEYGERTMGQTIDGNATIITGKPMARESSGEPVPDNDESTIFTRVSAVTTGAAEIMGRYREKFIKEARTIARLDHPGIVRIHDVFEENDTAYYVMEFVEGENLNDLVKREGALSVDRAVGYVRQVADALSYVHSHRIMHLDVKPANILVRKSDDKAILIDFGMAKQYDSSGTQTSTTPIGVSAGYAPIELMKAGGVQAFSPETDLYSLGATLYYLVSGHNPPDASERMEMVMEGERLPYPPGIPDYIIEAVETVMTARKHRPNSVMAFLELLDSQIGNNRIKEEQRAAEIEKRRLEEERARSEADARKEDVLLKEEKKRAAKQKKTVDDIALAESLKDLIDQNMVSIPAGVFSMGHDSTGWLFNSNASPLESPKHQVRLSGFSINKYTVTHKIWNMVMGDNQRRNGPEDIPIDNVSWNEIQVFISRLNKMTGENYRLPTEAEWEYAARGGRSNREVYAGDDNIELVGWYKENSSMLIHPGGQKLSNGYGLFDMSGNVWEWCADGFQKYNKDSESNPFHENADLKVLRGGSCASEKWKCRVTCRASAPPETRKQRYGFRLAK